MELWLIFKFYNPDTRHLARSNALDIPLPQYHENIANNSFHGIEVTDDDSTLKISRSADQDNIPTASSLPSLLLRKWYVQFHPGSEWKDRSFQHVGPINVPCFIP